MNVRAALPMILSVLLAAPAAAQPDQVSADYSVGSGPVAAAFTATDRLGVVLDADGGTLSVIDTADLLGGPTSYSTCDAPRDVDLASSIAALVVACGDGTLERYTVSTAYLPAILVSQTAISLGDAPDLVAIAAASSDVYAASSAGMVHAADMITSSEVTEGEFPYDLTALVAEASPVAMATDTTGERLIVGLATGQLIDLDLSGDSIVGEVVETGAAGLVDVIGSDPFLAMADDGTVVSYVGGALAAEVLGQASGAGGLALFEHGGDCFVAAAGGGTLDFLDCGDGSLAGQVGISGGATGVAASGDGYLLVVDPTADLAQVLTVNPWVRIDAVEPDPVDPEGQVTLTLSSDADGTLSLLLGGDVDETGSDLSPDVTALSADTDTDVSFDASLLAEGDNTVFAFVEAADGAVGRNAVQVTVPSSVEVPAPQALVATAGSTKVTLSWAPVEEDGFTVDHYLVYFGIESFDPADGDPAYCDDEAGLVCSGFTVTVDAGTSTMVEAIFLEDDDDSTGDDDDSTGDDDTGDDDTGDDDTTGGDDSVTTLVSPLTNDVTYYFAVAAVTSDELTGEFTDVVSAMPQETGGAAWLAGDTGGYGCSGCTVAGAETRGLAAVALLGLAALLRRRQG